MLINIAIFFSGVILGQIVLLFFMGAGYLNKKQSNVFGNLQKKGV